jgi:hypothetical protein
VQELICQMKRYSMVYLWRPWHEAQYPPLTALSPSIGSAGRSTGA